jgi:hypothetical protein
LSGRGAATEEVDEGRNQGVALGPRRAEAEEGPVEEARLRRGRWRKRGGSPGATMKSS